MATAEGIDTADASHSLSRRLPRVPSAHSSRNRKLYVAARPIHHVVRAATRVHPLVPRRLRAQRGLVVEVEQESPLGVHVGLRGLLRHAAGTEPRAALRRPSQQPHAAPVEPAVAQVAADEEGYVSTHPLPHYSPAAQDCRRDTRRPRFPSSQPHSYPTIPSTCRNSGCEAARRVSCRLCVSSSPLPHLRQPHILRRQLQQALHQSSTSRCLAHRLPRRRLQSRRKHLVAHEQQQQRRRPLRISV